MIEHRVISRNTAMIVAFYASSLESSTGMCERELARMARIISAWTVASAALAQEANVPNDVQQGKRLALRICANCHLVAPDARQPILQPPAPSFDSIAQRSTTTADYLRMFLKTTHRGLRNLQGMPNLELSDWQIEPLTAYLLSLRKQP